MGSRQVTFSTARRGEAADDAFAAYHDLYAPVADALRLGADFAATVTAHRLGALLVFDRRLRSVAHVRDKRRVARNAFDHVTVQVARRGSFRIATEAGEREVEQGALALVDMTQWMRTEALDTHLLTLSVPRPVLDAAVGDAGRLHGRVVPASRASLLGDFVDSVLGRQDTLAPADDARIERVTGELLALALSDRSLEDRALPEAAGEMACRARAKRYIEAHLGCTPAEVAAASGHSRSVLYRAFQPYGGLAAYIQDRRVARLRALLVAPGESRRISELAFACGFASASHGARAFRARFGLSPADLRAARHAAPRSEGQGEAHDVLAQWWEGLR